MKPQLVDPVTDQRWSAFVERATDGTVFHHPRWLGLLRAQYGYHLTACCAMGGDGTIVAGLPLAYIKSRITGRRLVALPFSDVCPPLIASGGEQAADVVADAVEAERRRLDVPLEVHERFPKLPSGHVVPRFYHHVLPLQRDVEAVQRRFRKSEVKRSANKARRSGLVAERRTDDRALDAFYRLHTRTRRRLGVPTQPRRFIRRLQTLFDEGLGFVMLVRRDDEVAAAAVFMAFNRTLTYKYGASERRFLKLRPNNLLFVELIGWGCENGFERLDFGRTDLDNEGLRYFKGSWGADERRLAYTYVPKPPPDDGDGLAARALKTAIQRSPPAASRLAGELLYKHYG